MWLYSFRSRYLRAADSIYKIFFPRISLAFCKYICTLSAPRRLGSHMSTGGFLRPALNLFLSSSARSTCHDVRNALKCGNFVAWKLPPILTLEINIGPVGLFLDASLFSIGGYRYFFCGSTKAKPFRVSYCVMVVTTIYPVPYLSLHSFRTSFWV